MTAPGRPEPSPAPSRARRVAATTGAALALALALVLLGPASPAGAHPLGNFTTNTSAAVRVRPDEVRIDYVVDLAEIPTLQARPGIDVDGDDDLSAEEQATYAATECDRAGSGLTLRVDGRTRPLSSAQDPDISFPTGQAGLDTLRVECHLTAAIPAVESSTTVDLVDTNFTDKLGWREVVALGDRTTIVDSDAPADSASDRLTSYPKDQIGSPPRELEATIRVVPGGPAAPDPDAGTGGVIPTVNRLTDLVGERRLTVPFAIFALGLAFVLGGFHALAPGHGKTVMAAYLVGSEGTRRQALLLGLTVAVTHTGGVFALALVVSNSGVAPERLYPYLGTFSGLLVIAIGAVLLRRAVRFRRLFPTLGPGASTHHHHGIGGHSHTHSLGGHTHDHELGHDNGHDHAEGHTHPHAGSPDHDHVHAETPVEAHDHAEAPAAVLAHSHGDGPAHTHGPDERHDHGPDHGSAPVAPTAAGGGTDPTPAPVEGGEGDEVEEIAPRMRLRNMMAMGFAGGLVPSPSALVVLLGSIAIGRAWFGLLLIVAYGAGLAAVLVGAGLVIERLRHRVEPLLARRTRPRMAALAVNLPIITSVLVVLGGAYLVARAVISA